jgi:hypothetical protein
MAPLTGPSGDTDCWLELLSSPSCEDCGRLAQVSSLYGVLSFQEREGSVVKQSRHRLLPPSINQRQSQIQLRFRGGENILSPKRAAVSHCKMRASDKESCGLFGGGRHHSKLNTHFIPVKAHYEHFSKSL